MVRVVVWYRGTSSLWYGYSLVRVVFGTSGLYYGLSLVRVVFGMSSH